MLSSEKIDAGILSPHGCSEESATATNAKRMSGLLSSWCAFDSNVFQSNSQVIVLYVGINR